ncbi:MAG: hypothetical protein U0746_00925 [Gemmataceae bacterium]
MRVLFVLSWLLVLVGGAAWHFAGPGQDYLLLDDIGRSLKQARAAAGSEDWEAAVELYSEALNALPADRVADARKIRVERAKAMMLAKQLPEAHADMKALVGDMQDDATADSKVLADARSTLANSQYYMTWLMRLEGLSREEWEPEIEAARQTYRLLAEEAKANGDTVAANAYGEDLESAIRLERMDLSELQGLKLPCQCNCNGSKCNGKCNCKGKKPGGKKTGQPKDARGASSGPPPDTGGH